MLVLEAAPTIGGGTRSAELTLPGFLHDVCSAVHPLVAELAVPVARCRSHEHGLELLHPGVALAHPLDDGTAVVLDRSLAATADVDRRRRRARLRARSWSRSCATPPRLLPQLLGPLRPPRHPVAARALRPPRALLLRDRSWPGGASPASARRALFAGCAAHSMLRLEQPAIGRRSASCSRCSRTLGGWPIARGGSAVDRRRARRRTCARSAARSARPARWSRSTSCRRPAPCSWTSRRGRCCGWPAPRLPDRYRRALGRYRYGPGRLQARLGARRPDPLDRPGVPPRRDRAPGRHARGDRRLRARRGRRAVPERPFVLMAQPTAHRPEPRAGGQARGVGVLPRARRAPEPDMTERIEAQIERFAPGFRDLVLGALGDGPGRRGAPQPELRGRRHQRRRARTCASCSRARCRGRRRTPPRWRASTSARRPRRPAAACTACAATTPPGPRCGARSRRVAASPCRRVRPVHDRARVARRSTRRRWRRSIPPARACRPTAPTPTLAPLSRATARSSFGLMELSG